MQTAQKKRLELAGCGALVTGASRGIGVTLAQALAKRGVRLVLSARDEAGLERVRAELAKSGAEVHVVPADVSEPAALALLVDRSRAALGAIDLLVNNAGVDSVSHFEDVRMEDLQRTLQVNLTAPMTLSRLVLPDMLTRQRGHIVNIASLAGLAPAAFSEAYCATKHGVVGFTRALRASLQAQGSAVSASAICPGFISDAGIYATQSVHYGVRAPGWLGTSPPDAVARAVLRAVERDIGEVVVSRIPMRPLLAVGSAFPRLIEWLTRALRANALFRQVADQRRVERLAAGRTA